MKKIKILLVLLTLTCITTGCFNDKDDEQDNTPVPTSENDTTVDYNAKLLKVLNSQAKFIDENNNKVLFKDFKVTDTETAVEEKHAFVDLDNDKIDELVVYTTSSIKSYMIFHYENSNIYGYLIGVRSLENLKKDGSFIGSNGVDSREYLTMSFDKNKYTMNKEAIYDGINKIYKIDNKDVTKDEIDAFISKFNDKSDVDFINK